MLSNTYGLANMPILPDQVRLVGGSSKSAGKHKSVKNVTKKKLDTRVKIGKAFDEWRSLKQTEGLKSDTEVAKYLLDLKLDKSPPDLPSTKPKSVKRFSQSEVQKLVKEEVHSTVKRKEMELQDLIDRIKQINHEVDFQSLIQKLQGRIDTVSRKADQALAYLTASPNKCPFPADIIREDPDDRTMETSSKSESSETLKMTDETLEVKTTKNKDMTQIIDKIKDALERLRSEKDVLMASVSGLNAEAFPPFLTPYGSSRLKKCTDKKALQKKSHQQDSESLKQLDEPNTKKIKADLLESNRLVKTEQTNNQKCTDIKTLQKEDPQQDRESLKQSSEPKAKKIKSETLENHPVEKERTSYQIVKGETPSDETLKQFDEPKVNLFKKKSDPPECSYATEKNDGSRDQELLSYPPLPPVPFPMFLSIEAASYSIPQKPVVYLALIKNPTRLSVLWKVTEVEPCAPPMESYTIFITIEKVKGSGTFPDWDTYYKVEAKTLPMCALIEKYKPGHKVCAAVMGKDKFGRYGPYSEVVTATMPE